MPTYAMCSEGRVPVCTSKETFLNSFNKQIKSFNASVLILFNLKRDPVLNDFDENIDRNCPIEVSTDSNMFDKESQRTTHSCFNAIPPSSSIVLFNPT